MLLCFKEKYVGLLETLTAHYSPLDNYREDLNSL